MTPTRPPKAAATRAGTVLQRQCDCGSHTIGGVLCERCRSGSRPIEPPSLDVPLGFWHDVSQAHVRGLIGAPAFVPERPAAARATRRARRSESPDERQADEMGAWIGQRLRSIAVGAGVISDAARRAVEPAFGVDLDGVRFHVGASARARVGREHALAMTEGSDISFADGQFAPATASGRALIGHELTHVAQQRFHRQPSVQHFGRVLNYEKLAREIEDAVSGPATDEEQIYRALTKLERDPESVTQLEATYRRLFGKTLMQALQGDLDSEEMDYARGLMGKPVAPGSKQRVERVTPATPAQWDALARRIKAAVEHGLFGGTDEEAIFAVLLPLAGDANKIAALKEAYARITRGPADALVKRIKSEMSGSELRYALQLLTVRDQHADTRTRLTRDEVLAVRNELQPGTAVTPPPPKAPGAPPPPLPPPARWDGRTGAPGAAAKRAALASKLRTALTNHLARAMPRIKAKAADPKLPISRIEGAANAAVEVTDDEYKRWYSVAATTPAQSSLRSGFQFSASAGNLLDATDPAARTRAGAPIDAEGQANWMIRHDNPPKPPGASEHMSDHDFDPDRDPDTDGESAWLQAHVIRPFASDPTRAADLRLYDQFGFALQPEPGKIMLTTTVKGGTLAGGGTPNEADRRRLWSIWHVAVHEYLHNLVHPAFEQSLSANNEGFTEYFTKSLLRKIAPVAHQNSGLVRKVEGGFFSPPTTPTIVGKYKTPKSYAADLAHVENVANIVPGRDNAMRSAYFQGHTELLGINPRTHRFAVSPPATFDPTRVNVPAGITTVDDLAARTGASKREILSANPGLAAAGPLPARLRVPGTRQHRVVTTFTSTGAAGPSETADQIAAQNGVSVAALKRANPGVNWATLAGGQFILIPRH
jgi:hypothetical protein